MVSVRPRIKGAWRRSSPHPLVHNILRGPFALHAPTPRCMLGARALFACAI